jgi:hypothetical protein
MRTRRTQRRSSSSSSGSGGDGVDFNKDNKFCLSAFGMLLAYYPMDPATKAYCDAHVQSS